MTASTWESAAGINGIILHSAFHLPVKPRLKFSEYKKLSDETLHMLRNKYQHLKVLIIDETLMIGRATFEHLHLALEAVMKTLSPFGEVSVKFDFLTKKVCSRNQVKDHIAHSMDRCGKAWSCMSWLKLFGRAVIQILLNYLIGFKMVSK